MRYETAVLKVLDHLRQNADRPEFRTYTMIKRECDIREYQWRVIRKILVNVGAVVEERDGNRKILKIVQ